MEKWSYVYDGETGALVSSSPTDTVASDEVLASFGRAVVRGLPGLDDTHAWDPEKRTVVEVAAPIRPRLIAYAAFIMAFTPEEYAAIKTRQASDVLLDQFMFALQGTPQIDMNGATTKRGLGYLVSVGILTGPRAAEIGAAQ